MAAAAVEEILAEEAPPLEMTSTEEDIVKQVQYKSSLELILDRERIAAVEEPIRAQFEDSLVELTEAEQDSKELKSAKRQLLFDRINETAELPFPVGPATVDGDLPTVKDGLTRQYVKRTAEAIYKDLVRRKIAVEKRRPDGRSAEEIRPIECEVGVAPRTHGSGLFTRGQTQIMSPLTLGTAKEGQRYRRPLARAGAAVHAPLQLPPTGRRDRVQRGPKRRDIGHGALAQRALS